MNKMAHNFALQKGGNIFLQQLLSKPVELSLKVEKKDNVFAPSGMKVVNTDFAGNREIKDFGDFSKIDQNNTGEGLISYLKYQVEQPGLDVYKKNTNKSEQLKEGESNIKVMICITVYNESASQLELTTEGIKKNLKKFKESGISNSEIAVVIIYDGIDRMNNSESSNDNMLKFFDVLDITFKIPEKDRMRTQYELYKTNIVNSKLDVQQFVSKKGNTVKELILDEIASKKYNQLKDEEERKMKEEFINKYGPQYTQNAEITAKRSREIQIEALKQVKKDAIKYIKDRHDSSWCYQVRSEVKDSKFDRQERRKKQLKKQKKKQYQDIDIEKNEDLNRLKQKEKEDYKKDKLEQQQQKLDAYYDRKHVQNEQDRFKIKIDEISSDEDGEDLVSEEEDSENDEEDQEKQLRYINEENLKDDAEKQKDTKKQMQDYLYKQPMLNMFFCAKFRNAQKLNSHLWFFEGFCETLKPEYVMLIDCGLEPDGDALHHFFQHMEQDPSIGGVCGFMGLRPEKRITDEGKRADMFDPDKVDWVSGILHRVFDIQKAQVFEYNFAHIIDKAFESLFGFIHVLPGAFSGYRYSALKSVDKKTGRTISILGEYLKTQLNPDYQIESLAQANMYLAEDRILCLVLYCRENAAFFLKYVPQAHAMVDPQVNLPGTMGQRRRWINGSWFALNHVLDHYWRLVNKSNHGCKGKSLLIVSMLYAQLGQVLTYLAIALYFSVMFMVYTSLFQNTYLPQPDEFEDSKYTSASLGLLSGVLFVYFMIVGAMVFFSLQYNHAHKRAYAIYYAISTILGIYMLVSFVFMLINVYEGLFPSADSKADDQLFDEDQQQAFKYMIIITIGGHALPILCNPCRRWEKICEIIFSTLSFIFYMPTYIHVFIIHAFCRIDDLSWGTKGADVATQNGVITGASGQISEQQEKYNNLMKQRNDSKSLQLKENSKFSFFFKWVLWNMIFSFLFTFLSTSDVTKKTLILIFAYYVSGFIVIRMVGALLFYAKNFYFVHFKLKRGVKGKNFEYKLRQRKIKRMTQKLIDQFWDQQQTSHSLVKTIIQGKKRQYEEKASKIILNLNRFQVRASGNAELQFDQNQNVQQRVNQLPNTEQDNINANRLIL